MANRKKQVHRTTADLQGISDYYKLNTRAVDDLVTADKDNSPEVSEEELRKYRSGSRIKLPQWLKAVLIKAWFAGAVCFFIFWGLGNYIGNVLDMLVVFGIVLGMVMELLVNSIFRYFEETPGANDRWMMFPKRSYMSFVLNLVYGGWLLFCVYTLYQAINGAIVALFGVTDTVPLGVEPILFGLFFMGFDQLFIAMKHLFLKIISDAKRQAS